jgi:hypothetical protein
MKTKTATIDREIEKLRVEILSQSLHADEQIAVLHREIEAKIRRGELSPPPRIAQALHAGSRPNYAVTRVNMAEGGDVEP